jgi:3-hydroxyisobutyrate dehydrogenase-like beta-hydroxyacid dehydrogenase
MGVGMAANLLARGHDVTVYNRSPIKAQGLIEQGARWAARIADACPGEAVLTMLADDAAVEGVVFGEGGVLESLRDRTIHVCLSTISVALSQRLAVAHAAAGQHYVAAPVFGRPEAAAAAKLFIIAAGPSDAVEACSSLLQAMGQRIFRFGDQAYVANLVKLTGNFLIGAAIEALGEAMALVDKAGVDSSHYLELLTSTLFDAPVYKTYGHLIADQKFEPAGFAAPLGLKDIRLALDAADSLHVPMPLGNLLRDRLLALIAQGGEALDWSAIGRFSARNTGQA